MHFLTEQRLDDDILERTFTLGEIPGILWTPTSTSVPAPLILIGHPGGLPAMYPRLLSRVRPAVAEGFAAATIELPGSGERATLDSLLDMPEIGGPVGYSGGVISIGTRLAAVEPRITAAVLFAGSYGIWGPVGRKLALAGADGRNTLR